MWRHLDKMDEEIENRFREKESEFLNKIKSLNIPEKMDEIFRNINLKRLNFDDLQLVFGKVGFLNIISDREPDKKEFEVS